MLKLIKQERVYNSSPHRLRPAARPRDPGILNEARTLCTQLDLTGSRGRAAGRRIMNCKQTLNFIVLSTLLCFFPDCQAATSPELQTQTKLKKIDAQISNLKNTLAKAQDKRGVLNLELASTEKQIGEGIHTLLSIQNTIHQNEQKIAALQTQANNLDQQLTTQQQLLAKHVRARYQMGEYQPLKWLINQDTPYRLSRVLSYYQYIVLSRERLINTISETKIKLNKNKEATNKELAANQILKHQLTEHNNQLMENKRYHTTLIQSLNNNIQTTELTLEEFKRNKENLSRLLQTLGQQSVVQASKPFAKMRRKLPLPVQTAHKSLQRMNQGVTFFADEGTAVTAIYPGKVVFSDWLKGYGLLLIIDHGQGFMSLYAHNQSLFKQKGQIVHQNEQIASVGHSGGIKENGLYFEIREKGKAVSPMGWLS